MVAAVVKWLWSQASGRRVGGRALLPLKTHHAERLLHVKSVVGLSPPFSMVGKFGEEGASSGVVLVNLTMIQTYGEWLRIQEQIHRIEGEMHAKSFTTQNHDVGMVRKFGKRDANPSTILVTLPLLNTVKSVINRLHVTSE
ncbi:hypothetical protein TNCV_1950861 [Trichonephila clavipes]|nr:hypothetical protein TNCV_1950861 [Trichonephila clavipes]